MAARETAIPGRTPCSTHPSTGKQSPPQRAPPAPPTPRHVTPRSAGLVRVDKSKSLSHPRRIHPVTKATYPPEAPAIAAHCAKPPWPPPNRTSTTAPHGARPMSTSGLRCLPRHRRHPPRRAHPPLTRPPSRHLRARRQGPRLLPAEPVRLKWSTTCTASAMQRRSSAADSGAARKPWHVPGSEKARATRRRRALEPDRPRAWQCRHD
jgi:hypothetical protein